MYVVKQVVGAFARPLTLSLCVVLLAGLFRLRGKRRLAKWILVSAVGVVYLSALAPVADVLLGPLERGYPPLQDSERPIVDYIVVLGAAYSPRESLPVTAALSETGVVRIVEGVRLMQTLDSAKLIVSGGAADGQVPSAQGYAILAGELGVSNGSIVAIDGPLDTAQEAEAITMLLGDAPFLLVTSAYHMPRAMRLMERAGGRPIPAPTGHHVNPSSDWDWRLMLPSSTAMRKTEWALHEYLGLVSVSMGLD